MGEESSGKSSVLQAISHLRFPTGENGCTRFATQVMFRQAPETRIDITIIFEDKSKKNRSLQNSGFQEDDLAHIIEEAKTIMEINRTGKDFSKDLLRLKIEGPQMYPLSLLDLPGFPYSDKSQENMEILQSLIGCHLDNKDNIFLVVINPNKTLPEQEVLRKSRWFDPHGERTIPIITKPDLMRPGSVEEQSYIKLAMNQLVFEVTKAFVDRVFQFVFGPRCFNRGIESILTTYVDPFFEERKVIVEAKINELFKPYQQGFAFPLDLDGYREFSQRSADRLSERVYSLLTAKVPVPSDDHNKERAARQMIREAVAAEKDSERRASGIDDVIDIMNVYYESSRRTFTENVINLAIESCLVCELPNILTPSMVHGMSNERLQELVAESEETICRRKALEDEIEVLRKGLAEEY
ncbi:hypothetical protein HZS61_005790 [Fusarium oxysporum f. sp. conglutinans]|uniref:GED domain-containing protein n=1 Tax=Fusarium oxysporum f. sp. conglutinans TaxID=100902 RepID=A0A8H6GBW1_FUSOX|nr:hypothetical protein HZS61_005790 [Fusarium oxysporum f. sp. conglutinans]